MSELSELNRRRDRLLELLKDEPSNSYNDYDRQLERIEQKIEIAEMCLAEREKTIDECFAIMKEHSNPLWHDWLDKIAEQMKK